MGGKKQRKEEADDEETTKPTRKAKKGDDGDGDKDPKKAKKATGKVKAEAESDASGAEDDQEEDKTSEEELDEDEKKAKAEKAYKWWRDPNLVVMKKGQKQWTTLEHNGVVFPPPYQPHGIPIKYLGQPFRLSSAEEELITHYVKMREMDQYRSEIFRKNFFREWKQMLDRTRGPENHPFQSVLNLSECDFDDIWHWHCAEREKRRNRSKEEKEAERKKVEEEVQKYKFCTWDGKRQEVGNYKVEPPGLFRGRGKHPKQGYLKRRIMPEDVTINIGEGVKPPECPIQGHHWGAIVHNHNAQWLCMWKDTVCSNFKYVTLAVTGFVKQIHDREKFEKARRLKEFVQQIRDDYIAGWKSSEPLRRQLGVCMYFIDRLALRVGNEKSTDEADTVGCTSLKVKNVLVKGNNLVHLSFLGKDSVPYENTIEVPPAAYAVISSLRQGKENDEPLFDLVDPGELNDYLKKFMPDLSAKVFRTYNASFCLEEYFRQNPMPEDLTIHEKILYFNKANLEVAILCNHQRNVAKGHGAAMSQLDSKLGYYKDLKARLIAARSARNQEAARRAFYEAEDKIQWEWLDEWGTDAEKEEYRTYVATRDGHTPKAPKSVKTKVETKTETKTEAEDENTDSRLAAALSGGSRKRGRSPVKAEVKEEADEDDTPASESEEGSASDAEPPKRGGKRGAEKNGKDKKAAKKKQPTSPKKTAKKAPAKKTESPRSSPAASAKSSPKKRASPKASPKTSPKKKKASSPKTSPTKKAKSPPKKASPVKRGGKRK